VQLIAAHGPSKSYREQLLLPLQGGGGVGEGSGITDAGGASFVAVKTATHVADSPTPREYEVKLPWRTAAPEVVLKHSQWLNLVPSGSGRSLLSV
jgi:hypothetical protein